jgi:hypothetical protein
MYLELPDNSKIAELYPDNIIYQGFLIVATGIFSVLLSRNLIKTMLRKVKTKFIN